MLRTVDRYLIREVIPPFAIVLVVFTFMLLMQPIMNVADDLIAKGVSWHILLRVMPTLLPSALALTIPMALLVGLLIALGRLSEDREWVALQACGVSIYRLVRPVAVLAVLGWLATSYVMIWALPAANQAYNEIVMPVLWSRAAGEIKPRVFFTGFPGKVLYVRDVAQDGTWRDVFLWDQGNDDMISVASRGRVEIDRTRRQARVVLENVTQHSGPPTNYKVNRGDEVSLKLDPETFFPSMPRDKGYNQKTIAELRVDIASLEARHIPAIEEPMAIQQKFSIPVACLIFAVIGLALGASSRRDGKMASFVLGIGVIFVYYVLMYVAQGSAKAFLIPAWTARWIPNVILGPLGVAALIWRGRFSERELRFARPSRARANGSAPATARAVSRPSFLTRVIVRLRLPHGWLPRPRVLDWYIVRTYFRILALTIGALLVIFYISEFIELSERIFRGTAKPGMVLLYYVYKTPWFLYFIIPLGGLIATLVTFGLLTRSSELVIMKACGISVYRAAMPVVVFAGLCSAGLFGLEERVLATTNRQWHKYDLIFRGMDPVRADMLNRGWVVSRDGRAIYHFEAFHQDKDQRQSDLYQLSVYTFDPTAWRMTGRAFATRATHVAASTTGQPAARWIARSGWAQQFPLPGGTGAVEYVPFRARALVLESPDYFGNEQPDAERMNYFTLRRYVEALRAGGFNEAKASVDLQRKIAFPFAAIVMALIAVPFAVTMGKRGAMYGIGLGVVLAIVYWVAAQVFAAFGAGGVLPPVLAAWAPNLLFTGGAAYMLLTVRT